MIYLDTCLVIYLVEDAERGPHVRELLARHGHEEFAISPLVRLEWRGGPLRSGCAARAGRGGGGGGHGTEVRGTSPLGRRQSLE